MFKNREKELSGVDNNYHYPKSQAMRLYSSLWDAEDWATRGGLVKTDWTKAPFVASFRNFNAVASSSSNLAAEEVLDSNEEQKLQWVRNNYMIYDYCADTKRFPQGLPSECKWALKSIQLHLLVDEFSKPTLPFQVFFSSFYSGIWPPLFHWFLIHNNVYKFCNSPWD